MYCTIKVRCAQAEGITPFGGSRAKECLCILGDKLCMGNKKFISEIDNMSQEELEKRNTNPFVQRVISWGDNPEVAMLRRGHVATARRADAYNLRCRQGQEKPFDVAISLTADGSSFHLKKTTVPKIDVYCDVSKLITISVNGQSDWVSIDTKDGMLSIFRKRLEATLRALGLLPAT